MVHSGLQENALIQGINTEIHNVAASIGRQQDSDGSGPQENALIQGINTEIHTVVAGIGRQVDSNPDVESLSLLPACETMSWNLMSFML